MARCNSLFANATTEKKVLITMADWYAKQRFELLRRPNIFSECATAMAFRHFAYVAAALDGKPLQSPRWVVRALAKVSVLIDRGEALLIVWQCRRFQQRLNQFVNLQHDADVMLGAVYFFSALRVEFSLIHGAQLPKTLMALAEASLASEVTPATRLLGKVMKLIQLEESTPYQDQLRVTFPALKEHVWRLLLGAAKQDREWALSFIDDHWRKPSKWGGVLSSFGLHGQSDLAYPFAMLTRPYRPAFAADLLLEAVRNAGWVATDKKMRCPIH